MKNFVAPDMRTALKMVREELGDDAVILANRRVAGGIELLATAEMPAPAPAPAPRSVEPMAPPAVPAPAAPERDPYAELTLERPRAGDAGWWQMQQELRSMRDLIEQQMSGFAWQQHCTQHPADAAMWRRLQRLGLEADTIGELLKRVGEGKRSARENWQQLMAQLSTLVPVADRDLVAGGGVFAFVGATGVGKTTTIGKLAARWVLAHGNSQVALVTLDSFRIGAHEQLRTLARILNVPMKVVSIPRDLGNVLYELRHCQLVLIDTAGLGTRAPELREQLAAIDAMGDRVQTLQVLAANAQRQVLRGAVQSYRTANVAGCVLTKLDEAASLGEVISLVARNRLPVAYVADGQAIPGDLAVAEGKPLVTRAIELAKQVEADEMQLAEVFAARPRPAGLSARI